MRIIFLTSKFNFTGGGGSSPELDAKVRALRAVGHEVSVVTVFSQQNTPFELPYPVMEERARTESAFAIQRSIFQLLKKYEARADLFCTEGQFSFGSGLYRLRGGRVPVAAHFNRELTSFADTRSDTRQHVPFKRRLRFLIDTTFGFYLVNQNDLLSFTSPVLRDAYVSLGLEKRKTFVAPDFFDTEALVARENITKDSAMRRGELKESYVIFCTGRLVAEKGFDIMLRAFARLPHERFHLCISGDGPEKTALMALARELNIASRVTFPGWITKQELDDWYRRADIFVIPRWRPELTSMLVFEALSFALPCIVVRDSAIAWQTQDAALTFRDEDDAELAAQILALADNPELRVDLARKGLARLRDLDYRKHIGALDTTLRRLVR